MYQHLNLSYSLIKLLRNDLEIRQTGGKIWGCMNILFHRSDCACQQ